MIVGEAAVIAAWQKALARVGREVPPIEGVHLDRRATRSDTKAKLLAGIAKGEPSLTSLAQGGFSTSRSRAAGEAVHPIDSNAALARLSRPELDPGHRDNRLPRASVSHVLPTSRVTGPSGSRRSACKRHDKGAHPSSRVLAQPARRIINHRRSAQQSVPRFTLHRVVPPSANRSRPFADCENIFRRQRQGRPKRRPHQKCGKRPRPGRMSRDDPRYIEPFTRRRKFERTGEWLLELRDSNI